MRCLRCVLRIADEFKDTLKPGVTVEQIQSARDQVRKAYDDLLNAAGDAAKERVDAVKSAQQKFAAAVSAIPDTATLSQAANSLRDEAASAGRTQRPLE